MNYEMLLGKIPFRRFAVCVLLALLIIFVPDGVNVFGQETESSDSTLIQGGHYFDTVKQAFRPNIGIGIKNGRIQSVGKKLDRSDYKRIIHLGEHEFLLPGFVDCHAHYNVRLFKKRREEFDVMPVIYLANGATVTFSCGEFDPIQMNRLRKRIESGTQVGPRLLNSGPYFGRARPGWPRNGMPESKIREEVDFWVGKGVAGFKAKAIDPDSLRILIDQAHRHGLTVTGHLDSGYRNSVNPRDAIEMGIDRIEHFLGGDAMSSDRSAYASLQTIKSGTPEFEKTCQLFIENGTFFDATLTAYGYLGIEPGVREEYGYWVDERQFFTPHTQKIVSQRKPMRGMGMYQRIYDAKLKTIAAFHQMGGQITLGTDHVSNGNHLPGFGVHREMDALSRAGIPNVDVLCIATINGAKALGIDQDHGSIQPGKYADLVVVQGNPIDDIRNTRNVRNVMKQGTWYSAEELLDCVKGRLGPKSKQEVDAW
ncbi:MAG: amidohydrolase family protein [Planctomycetota bacterium]